MCKSSPNFFNDKCHAAVLADVNGMSQLPEHRPLTPFEMPWDSRDTLMRLADVTKHAGRTQAPLVSVLPWGISERLVTL